MLKSKHTTFQIWATSVLLYLILYFYHGIIIFGNDTIETVPYALWMNDESLFSKDFHLSFLRNIFPNERWLTSFLLHFFPNHIEYSSRALHFISGLFLLSGLLQIAQFYLKRVDFSIVTVYATLVAFYNINVGGNELYYNMFVPSVPAKAIAVWALYFFFLRKIWRSYLLLILSTLFQPLVGVQLFLIYCGIQFVFVLQSKTDLKQLIVPSMTYLTVATCWIGAIIYGQGPSDHTFLEIIEFRIGHHFLPSAFDKKPVYFLLSLYVISIFFIRKRTEFFWFFIFSLLGVIVYVIGLEYADSSLILSTQWMKINIWLKFLGFLSLFIGIRDNIESKHWSIISTLSMTVLLILSIIRFNPSYDSKNQVEMYNFIEEHTEIDDVFLVPYELTDFKAIAKRSTYFDFKAMLHYRPAIYEWKSRLHEVYGYLNLKRNKTNFFQDVKEHYLKGSGVPHQEIDYIIANVKQTKTDITRVLKGHNDVELWASNKTYNIWRIH